MYHIEEAKNLESVTRNCLLFERQKLECQNPSNFCFFLHFKGKFYREKNCLIALCSQKKVNAFLYQNPFRFFTVIMQGIEPSDHFMKIFIELVPLMPKLP